MGSDNGTVKFTALWMVCGVAGGAAGAWIYGDFGSIVILATGVLVGASGALAHGLLLRKTAIGRRGFAVRVLALWLGALALPAIWIAVGAFTASLSRAGSALRVVEMLGGSAAAIALVAALVICWVASSRRPI